MSITRDELRQYISERFGVNEAELHNDTLLFSTGVLDSFSLLDLITFIEGKTGIKVSPTEVNLENMDSLDRITAFVQRRTG